MQLKDYLTQWIQDKCLNVKPVTAAEYRRYSAFIQANCPCVPLKTARPQQISAIWAPLVHAGKLRSAQLLRQLIVAALRDAAAMGQIPVDFTRRLRPIRHKPKKTAYLEPKQIKLLLSLQTPHKAAYALCCLSGLRRREAAELTWQDITATTLQIRNSKTESGVRLLPLSPQLRAILDRQRRNQRAACLAAGEKWSEACAVVTADGAPMRDPRLINRWLAIDAGRAGLGHVTPHMLRDTYATMAVDAGIDMRVLQVLLGHAEISTTARFYAHVRQHVLTRANEQIMLAFVT